MRAGLRIRCQRTGGIRVFSIAVLGMSLIYWIVQVLTRGAGIQYSFCNYTEHLFGNDFFFPMAAGQYENPWAATGLNYPAGAILVGRALLHALPADSIFPYGSADYQTYTYSVATLILMFFIGTIILLWCIMRCVRASESDRFLLSSALMLSAPMMFEWVSGNYILIAVGFTFCFLLLYDSPTRYQRLISYIMLGVASSLKLYPAAFSWIVLLGRRDKKEFFSCILVVVTLTLAPFFLYDGIESVGAFLQNLLAESDIKADWGMGYNYSLQNTVKTFSFLLGGYVYGSIPAALKVVAVVILLAQTLILRQKWQRAFLISLCFIWYFDYSYAYTLLFLIPPLCLFFSTEMRNKRRHVAIIIGFVFIFAPSVLPGVVSAQSFIQHISPDAVFIYPLSWGHVLTMIGLLLIEFDFMGETIIWCFEKWKHFIRRGNLEECEGYGCCCDLAPGANEEDPAPDN